MASASEQDDSGVSKEELLTGKQADKTVQRRGIVKGLLGSVAGLVGFSGSSAAESQPNQISRITNLNDAEVVKKYENTEMMRSVLRDHEQMLKDLHEESLIEAPTAAELQINDAEIDGDEQVAVRKSNDGVTPEIRLFRRTEAGSLTVGVQPETGEQYAVLTVDGEPQVLDEITTSGCSDPCCDEAYECCEWNYPDCGGTACDPFCERYCLTCYNCDCNLSCAEHCV